MSHYLQFNRFVMAAMSTFVVGCKEGTPEAPVRRKRQCFQTIYAMRFWQLPCGLTQPKAGGVSASKGGLILILCRWMRQLESFSVNFSRWLGSVE